MIVCFTTGSKIEGVSSDHIHAFREDTKGAFAQYNKLVYNSNDVISASICQVIDSTDYDGMWDSEVGEDNLVDPNMKKYIDHQIEIITDSDWFEELVKDKVKEVSDETISRFTEHYLGKTKVRKGDFDWNLYNMKEELTDEQEALRQLNGLIESIATGNNTRLILSNLM